MNKKFLALIAILLTVCCSLNAQIFYKIEGNGLKAPSYIFGTHHLAPLAVIDSIPGCMEAFKGVDQVVGEIDMTMDQMQLAAQMQPYMMAPQDSTLSKLIAPEDYARINEEFKKWAPMPGMSLEQLDMLKPMVVTSMVAIQMVMKNLPGFNPQEQLDSYFQLQGKQLGKNIKGLETPEYQAKVLYCTLPVSSQAKGLVELLDDPEKSLEKTKQLNESYLKHDLQTLVELSEEEDEDDSKFMDALLTIRNANWIKEIPGIISQTPSFIAVGALHLPGENGVIEGLRKAGYTVTPVK